VLKFEEIIFKVLVRIARPCQSTARQLRHQPVAHLHEVAPVEYPVEEQKAVTADFLIISCIMPAT
jgi:hypothetical protein